MGYDQIQQHFPISSKEVLKKEKDHYLKSIAIYTKANELKSTSPGNYTSCVQNEPSSGILVYLVKILAHAECFKPLA